MPFSIAAFVRVKFHLLKAQLGSLVSSPCPGSSNPGQVAAASLEPKTIKNELVPALLDSFCVSLCSEPDRWVQTLKQCGAGLLFMLASRRLASTRLNGFLRQLGIFMASFDWMVFGVETEGSPDERAATIHCRCWKLQHKERRPCLAPQRTFFFFKD